MFTIHRRIAAVLIGLLLGAGGVVALPSVSYAATSTGGSAAVAQHNIISSVRLPRRSVDAAPSLIVSSSIRRHVRASIWWGNAGRCAAGVLPGAVAVALGLVFKTPIVTFFALRAFFGQFPSGMGSIYMDRFLRKCAHLVR